MTMSEAPSRKPEAAILDANARFYRAFSEGDYAAMAELWAARAPIACFHPGMSALIGREVVLDSWQQILREASGLVMRCDHARVQLLGEVALVLCYEGNAEQAAHLAATNAFVLEDGRWRMVHHHAGPLARPVAKPSATSRAN
jgi:ketosteroid isomerase-like protein